MAYVIYSATQDDIEDIITLVNRSYRGDASRAGWTTEADFLSGQRTDAGEIREQLQKGTMLCLRADDQLVGCVFIQPVSGQEVDCCYLGMLTVDPEKQSDGLGRLLLERAEERARRSYGAKRMTLGVVQLRSTLIAWYERCGYNRTGETKPFPYGNERYGIPLRDDLQFIMFEKSL